jgi:hypothetical protein
MLYVLIVANMLKQVTILASNVRRFKFFSKNNRHLENLEWSRDVRLF